MQRYLMKVIHAAFEDAPVHVATVNTTAANLDQALQFAFQLTNNIEGSWSKPAHFEYDGETVVNLDYNECVTVEAPLPIHKHTGAEMGLRSTSMGDYVQIGDDLYVVAMIGFEKATEIKTHNVFGDA